MCGRFMTVTSMFSSPIEGAIDTNSSSPSSDILQLLLFEDILVSIFKYLPKGDLLNCALVCKVRKF